MNEIGGILKNPRDEVQVVSVVVVVVVVVLIRSVSGGFGL